MYDRDGRWDRFRETLARRTDTVWSAARRSAGKSLEHGLRHLTRLLDGGYDPQLGSVAPPAIACADLTVAYHSTIALESVTVEFPSGSMTAVVGPNGGGKSTLLKAMTGILQPQRGRIGYQGPSPPAVAYLPQSDDVDRAFPMSAGEFVALGAWRGFGAFAAVPVTVGDEVSEALEAVGLKDAYDRPIGALSVGQFRRVLFARLTLQRAPVLLLDEPFASVDAATTADLLRLVEQWHGEGRTIVAVLHDLAQVRRHFPLSVLLARHCIASGNTDAVLTPQNLARAGFAPNAVDAA